MIIHAWRVRSVLSTARQIPHPEPALPPLIRLSASDFDILIQEITGPMTRGREVYAQIMTSCYSNNDHPLPRSDISKKDPYSAKHKRAQSVDMNTPWSQSIQRSLSKSVAMRRSSWFRPLSRQTRLNQWTCTEVSQHRELCCSGEA